ncbi:MAG: hypothetical protein AAFX57_15405, partial [Bacteroidota bacterium]
LLIPLSGIFINVSAQGNLDSLKAEIRPLLTISLSSQGTANKTSNRLSLAFTSLIESIQIIYWLFPVKTGLLLAGGVPRISKTG